ncbi:2-phospho-L-lactate guanylyltransferase [Nocardia sp. CC227C]|uniref:2-phospho-L-lactate guanylyltransferase n=1 Tax=Nocardia sp. CC227C TaxID=3044562 RepID=UPI00278C6B16|nr:2-phospho-L-lactate guanylyltransferase [Nocardia sp. CC227C]
MRSFVHAVIAVKSLELAKSRLADRLHPHDRPRLVLAMLADTVDAAAATPEIGSVTVVTPDPRVADLVRGLGAHVHPEPPGPDAGQSPAVTLRAPATPLDATPDPAASRTGGVPRRAEAPRPRARGERLRAEPHRQPAGGSHSGGPAPLHTAGFDPVPPRGGLNAALSAAADAVRRRHGPVELLALQADLPALRPAELSGMLTAAPGNQRAVVADHTGTGTVALLVRDGSTPLAPLFGADSARRHIAAGAVALLGDWPGLRQDVDTADDLGRAMALGVGVNTRALLGELGMALPGDGKHSVDRMGPPVRRPA